MPVVPIPGDAPQGVVPTPNGSIPAMFGEIWARLSEAERKTLYSAVISSGGLIVQDGGAMRLRISDGGDGFIDVFYCGPLTFGGPPVIYNGIILRRPDGSPIFYTFPVGGDINDIAYRFLDHLGNEIIASDAITGGLAKPWIPLSGVPVLSNAIPMTTTAAFITVWSTGSTVKQQPFVELQALIRSDTGATGNARFVINGTPVGASMPIAAGAFAWQSTQVIALPGEFYDYVTIELDVQRTNAVGSVGGVFKGSQRQT